MKLKRFEEGGSFTELGGSMDILGGAVKSIYGFKQLKEANREYDRAKAAAPSLETASQFYENYKNAHDSELARIEMDAIQGNVATSIQALQGAGGRALVGGLGAAVANSQTAQNRMLSQERQQRTVAGARLAQAESQAIGRKEARSQNEIQQAQASAAAARQNIVNGVTGIATGAMAGGLKPIGKAAKAAFGAVKSAPSKFRDFMVDREIRITKEAIGPGESNENMQNFILNQNDYIKSVRDSWQEYEKPDYNFNQGNKTFNIVEENIDRAAVTQQQLIEDQRATALPPQDVTGNRAGGGSNPIFSGIGSSMPSEKEMEFNLGEVGKTPYNPNGFWDRGQFIPNPGGNIFGNIPSYTDGGMMTKGSFNHGSNPIDIVQEGVKVGEATGGEYILNPEQAKKIQKESTYARKLFKSFEKKAKSNK